MLPNEPIDDFLSKLRTGQSQSSTGDPLGSFLRGTNDGILPGEQPGPVNERLNFEFAVADKLFTPKGLSDEEAKGLAELETKSENYKQPTPVRSVGSSAIPGNPFSLDTRGLGRSVSGVGARINDGRNQRRLIDMAPELRELAQREAMAESQAEARQRYLEDRIPEVVDQEKEKDHEAIVAENEEKERFYRAGLRLISAGELEEAKTFLERAGLTPAEIHQETGESVDERQQEAQRR